MNKTTSKNRGWILLGLVALILVGYILKLMQIQIVDAEKYKALVQGRTVSTQPIKAVRGEIVDRNGNPVVQNKTSYNVIVDKAFLPTEDQNDIILKIIDIFEENSVKWIDDFPVTTTAPFEYLDDKEKETETIIKNKELQVYTTAEDMIKWLTEVYRLEDYTPEEARKIIAVRYQMEQKDFSFRTPYIFARDIPNTLVIEIKERSYEIPGINVESSAVRTFPDEGFAPHIIGQTGPLYKEEYDQLKEKGLIQNVDSEVYDTRGYTLDDTIGKSGIEKSMEEYLRGDNGIREIQVDSSGNAIDAVESISPIPGKTVVLTIDAEMQKRAQQYIESQIKYLSSTQPPGRGAEANAGAVVVTNVKTGEILAAATYPSYTVTEYKENYSDVRDRDGRPLINRATSGEYTPGSIYKPLVAVAGINSGAITPETSFNCTYTYYRFAPSYTPKCLSHHGHIGLTNAIGWSCNIYFYEAGWHTGIDEIDKMAEKFGLGQPTGVEIDEASGQRSNPETKASRNPDPWTGADTIQTAIGQFDTMMTPLQMANYAATIANHGKRMKLTFIKEIRDYNGDEIIEPFEPEIAYDMSNEVSDIAFDATVKGMINATTGSAGGTFSGYPITVASKTGTPQVTVDEVNSTFICFAPAEDPEIAVSVVIERGWQGYTGAPVAKAILDDYFSINHRGAVASGPPQLKDQWAKEQGIEVDYTPTPSETPSTTPNYTETPVVTDEYQGDTQQSDAIISDDAQVTAPETPVEPPKDQKPPKEPEPKRNALGEIIDG